MAYAQLPTSISLIIVICVFYKEKDNLTVCFLVLVSVQGGGGGGGGGERGSDRIVCTREDISMGDLFNGGAHVYHCCTENECPIYSLATWLL